MAHLLLYRHEKKQNTNYEEVNMTEKKKRKFEFPETALLLFIIIAVVAGLTYILPAGQFERVLDAETGRELVKAGTYTITESNPTTLSE